MLTSLVVAGFTLLGVLIGNYLHRGTQHQHWLLEKRAEAFGRLLETLLQCDKEAAQYLRHWDQKETIAKEQKLIDIFEPLLTRAQIAALFAPRESGDQIKQLCYEIYTLTASTELGDIRFKQLRARKEQLQVIFEKILRDVVR